MRIVLRILGGIVLAVALCAAGLLAWLALKKPAMRPPSTEKIEATPERLTRGRYLTLHVADCLGCHSDHHFDRFAVPLKAGTEGQGGFLFDKKLGVPGLVQAQNITPDREHGLGGWSDGEILRAMREGVNRKGEALFPMMPYEKLRVMSDEDAMSIVAYLRTLKPVDNAVAPRRLDFPVNFLVMGQEFSGGWLLPGPWGRAVSANLTPDPDNYMGQASREEFIDRFKSLEHLDGENAPVAPPGRNTVMAWPSIAGMTREDLGAIYDYLKTLEPIKKKVVFFPDAPPGTSSRPESAPTP